MSEHVIWGAVEPSSDCSSGDVSSAEWGKGKGPLPPLVQKHLERVKFHDYSSSSPDNSGERSSSSLRAQRNFIRAGKHEAAAQLAGASASEGPWADGVAGVRRRQADVVLGGALSVPEEPETGAIPEAASAGAAHSLLDAASLWSKGSALHSDAKCRPCHYVHTSMGCMNGRNCSFCHFPHTRKSRPRPCKSKRLQCKNIADMLLGVKDQDPDQFVEVAKAVCSQSSYLEGILQKRSQLACEAEEPAAASKSSLVSL